MARPATAKLDQPAWSLLRQLQRCTIVDLPQQAKKLAGQSANRGIDDALKNNHAG